MDARTRTPVPYIREDWWWPAVELQLALHNYLPFDESVSILHNWLLAWAGVYLCLISDALAVETRTLRDCLQGLVTRGCITLPPAFLSTILWYLTLSLILHAFIIHFCMIRCVMFVCHWFITAAAIAGLLGDQKNVTSYHRELIFKSLEESALLHYVHNSLSI